MQEEMDEAERGRIERLARQVGKDLDYANAAGFGDPIKDRMTAQYERLTDKLGYEPEPLES